MRTIIHMTMAILLLSLFASGAAFTQPAGEGSCPLSTLKNGEAVSIHGRIADGAHDMLLAIPGCDKVVVLEYAGGPETGESGDKLIRDDNFRRFEKYTRATYKNNKKDARVRCPKYEVEATFAGRLDVAADSVPEGMWKDKLGMLHDQSGKFVGKAGFGHPPIYSYRLVINSVSDVVKKKTRAKVQAQRGNSDGQAE